MSGINKHFNNEFKIMIGFIIAPIILGIVVNLVYPYIFTQTNIDKCLVSGGSFNYDACKCDYSKNHKFKDNHQCN